MRFTKMHGAGNDFILLDNRGAQLSPDAVPALAQRLCAMHTGLGADGLMLIVPARQGGDYGMRFYNADGTVGEMCGNGARCICRYGYEHGLAGERQRVETDAGLVVGERIDARRYRVRLNDPSLLQLHRTVSVDGLDFDCAYLELGRPGLPHAVLLLPDWDAWALPDLRRLGAALRSSPAFPRGANVSFVRLLGPDRLKAVTFERGVEDFTLACGTGSGSIVAALTLLGLVSGHEVAVEMPGGTLSVSLSVEADRVHDIFLTGPTCVVCEGELTDEILGL